MYRATRLTLLFLFGAFLGHAQDLNADLDRIVRNIDSTASMSIEASVKVYGRKGGSMIYSTNASVYRNSSASLTKLGEQEYFVGKQYDVTIDHEEKSVLIVKKETVNPKKSKKQSLDLDVASLKKLLETDEQQPKRKVTLVSNQSGKKTYAISDIPGMKEVRMIVDMNDLSIRSITYEYNEEGENKGQYVSVVYTEFQKDADVTSRLRTSNYFSESGDGYILSSRLKNYKLYTEL